MHAIAFSASPRKAGNSEILLDRVIEGLRSGDASVEKIRTHDLDVFPCTGCGGCDRDGECVIHDDFRGVREKIIACDGIIFASPLYFMNIPARERRLLIAASRFG